MDCLFVSKNGNGKKIFPHSKKATIHNNEGARNEYFNQIESVHHHNKKEDKAFHVDNYISDIHHILYRKSQLELFSLKVERQSLSNSNCQIAPVSSFSKNNISKKLKNKNDKIRINNQKFSSNDTENIEFLSRPKSLKKRNSIKDEGKDIHKEIDEKDEPENEKTNKSNNENTKGNEARTEKRYEEKKVKSIVISGKAQCAKECHCGQNTKKTADFENKKHLKNNSYIDSNSKNHKNTKKYEKNIESQTDEGSDAKF